MFRFSGWWHVLFPSPLSSMKSFVGGLRRRKRRLGKENIASCSGNMAAKDALKSDYVGLTLQLGDGNITSCITFGVKDTNCLPSIGEISSHGLSGRTLRDMSNVTRALPAIGMTSTEFDDRGKQRATSTVNDELGNVLFDSKAASYFLSSMLCPVQVMLLIHAHEGRQGI